jgi:hypothetical protein
MQHVGIDGVVFHRVPVADDAAARQGGDGPQRGVLDFGGQRAGKAVHVDAVVGQPFGLQEELVAVAVGEAVDLVLDGRTVPRTDARDAPVEQRRARKPRPQGFVGVTSGAHDVTLHAIGHTRGARREGPGQIITRLGLGQGPIDGRAIQSGGGAGLEASQRERQVVEHPRDALRGSLADAPPVPAFVAAVQAGAGEGPGGEHDASGVDPLARDQPHHPATRRRDELFDLPLHQGHSHQAAQTLLHPEGVAVHVLLGPRPPHRRTARGVEHAEMDAVGVGGFAHPSTQGIDLADQLAFGHASDGGVAAHAPDGAQILGDHRHRAPHPHSRSGGLDGGVPAPTTTISVSIIGKER